MDAAASSADSSAQAFRRVSFDLREGRMAGIAFGDPSRPVDIVFVHATGLNALTYRALLGPLGERFHVVAVDMRGHGLTNLPPRKFGYVSWRTHQHDLLELLETHFREPVALAGHSMGATVSLLAAAKRPDIARGLALIDPVIMRERTYVGMELPFMPLLLRQVFPIARGAARRRGRFESREAAFNLLKGRGFFKTWPDAVLADYLTDGLVADEVGGMRLACSPSYEAATFAAQRNYPWPAVRKAPSPLLVLRAEKNSTLAMICAKKIARLRPDARIATVEGASHALPMERPDRARAIIESAAMMAHGGKAFRDLD